MIPATTFARRISGGLQKYVAGSIAMQAAPGSTATVKPALEALLRDRHRVRADADDDFSARDLSEIASAQQESVQTITSLLAGVALVSLLVGGIGIMNIMLVGVTERIREIGLRMAVGAKPWHILAQFLSEAVALSIAGGTGHRDRNRRRQVDGAAVRLPRIREPRQCPQGRKCIRSMPRFRGNVAACPGLVPTPTDALTWVERDIT
jgi:hypothetical protein